MTFVVHSPYDGSNRFLCSLQMVCAALEFMRPQQILSRYFHLVHAEKLESQAHTRFLENVSIIYGLEATCTNFNINKDLISKRLKEIKKIQILKRLRIYLKIFITMKEKYLHEKDFSLNRLRSRAEDKKFSEYLVYLIIKF